MQAISDGPVGALGTAVGVIDAAGDLLALPVGYRHSGDHTL